MNINFTSQFPPIFFTGYSRNNGPQGNVWNSSRDKYAFETLTSPKISFIVDDYYRKRVKIKLFIVWFCIHKTLMVDRV